MTNPLNIQDLDQNQIMSHLDELLRLDISIDDIVGRLDDIMVVAHYDQLVQKGATQIDLDKLKDSVNPIVILNNLEVFQKAGILLNYTNIIINLSDGDALSILPYDTNRLLELGVAPQLIADKCMTSEGPILNFVQESLPKLLSLGVRIDGDMLVNKLISDLEVVVDFNDEVDIHEIERAGASVDSLSKLRKYLDDHTDNSPTIEERNIRLEGKQITKIFFSPQIHVISQFSGRAIPINWSGRILEGQTIDEGIAGELREVYGYIGKFDYRDVYFLDYVKDKQGNDIERYGLYITLYPSEKDELPN